MKRRVIAAILVTLLSVNIISCGTKDGGAKTEKNHKATVQNESGNKSGKKLDVTALKKKYSNNEKLEYKDPLYNLNRNHAFEFTISKDVVAKYKDKLGELVTVYLDGNLKMPVEANISYDDKKEKLVVQPPNIPILNNDEDFDKSRTDINVDNFDVTTSRENELDWGNANNYYLVQNINYETGERLAKSEVTIFTVKPELQTPTAQFYLSNSGKAGIKWNEVKGASKYEIYSIREDIDSKYYSLYKVGETKKTNFEDFLGAVVDFEDMVITTNNTFNADDKGKYTKYCVMAVAEDKKSLVSNIINTEDYASQVPVEAANDMNNLKMEKFTDFPTHLYLKMADGSTTLTPVDFDRDYVKFVEHEKHGLIVQVRYKFRGTSLVAKYSIKVNKEDEATKKEVSEVLKILQDRQDKIKWNGLNSDVKNNIETTPPSDMEATTQEKNNNEKNEETVNKENTNKKDEGSKEEIANKEEKNESKNDEVYVDENVKDVYASNTLSEYIALNLLSGNEKINLKDFKEVSDKEVLLDAFYEALYQNPLVMAVDGIGFDYKTSELIIQYGQSTEEQKKMQKEVEEKIQKVTKEIIKEGMTDIEKEFAINQYLCDTAKYDDDALKSAVENDMQPDAKFNPSFTPYGVLINKVGVCASYAGAFKLLADEAGLKSIVVTGNLNGSLPHAWNRVLIDGQWMSLDATNNDNDTIPNALVNLPDKVAKTVLVEDDKFVLDNKLNEFRGKEETLEYYKVNNKFFDSEKAVSALAKQLKEGNKAVIRTNYDLTEEEAAAIVVKACKEAGVKDIKSASAWIGVISVEK